MTETTTVFPNESAEYRAARNNLLEAEIGLRTQLEAVAAKRRALPLGGAHEENLLPRASLNLWAYTDLADPRWTWGSRFVILRQDPAVSASQKVGLFVPTDPWVAYARAGHMLVKTVSVNPGAVYPDRGSNLELFANDAFLETETLGPLAVLQPGQSAEHVEDWYLFDGVPQPQSEADVIEHVAPLVGSRRGPPPPTADLGWGRR